MSKSFSTTKYTLGVVQMAMEEKVENNILHALDMCEQAVSQGAQVLLLPELFSSLYFCQREDVERFRY
ncbi:MAG TPA: nitrilase-related carbon-nitrogen hydrolase, partial [Candidatus Hydrogenedentes bacterium]|nr:nitrilase-related carbon-nitrogen hydrolase [Candidatus Hydrogenedentota bacterium]